MASTNRQARSADRPQSLVAVSATQGRSAIVKPGDEWLWVLGCRSSEYLAVDQHPPCIELRVKLPRHTARLR
ncbi:hypothetical protein [Micromonospora sp. NPDC050495]|uniref:hypothetical protein n=1 Tax=Micromonospora sp. NPDC050495 TaxID=3154936 RepID=UPI0033DC7B22